MTTTTRTRKPTLFLALLVLSAAAAPAPARASLLASTFLGGSGDDGLSSGLIVAADGTVYVAGGADSPDFPSTVGAFDPTYNGGGGDVFVARFTSDLSTLLACTFLGGSGPDGGWPGPNLALDEAGNVYVSGQTYSSDFPFTPGAADSTYGGAADMFVAKLSPDLSTLLSATYVGGNTNDWTEGIAVEEDGDVVVVGSTNSTDYPATPGAYSAVYMGGNVNYGDVVVTRLDNALGSFEASTYFGASSSEAGATMALAPGGRVYVGGYTWSLDFPVTPGAYDTTGHSSGEAFIARFDSLFGAPETCTLLGGSLGWDILLALAVEASGDVFVTGHTGARDFPFTHGAYDTSYNSTQGSDEGDDVFVCRFDPDLATLHAATYLGGRKWESSSAIVPDGSGHVYLTGSTRSPNFPTTPGAYDTTYNGGMNKYAGDLWVSRLDRDLTTLSASSFLGSDDLDFYGYLALDAAGNVYVAGSTADSLGISDFPATAGAYDETYNGGFYDWGGDVVVCKLDSLLSAVSTSVGAADAPWRARLRGNEPNPFNPTTAIRFDLAREALVCVAVHDVRGRTVAVLFDGDLPAGAHRVGWNGLCADGREAPSGVYFARVTANGWTDTRKMTLVR
jgi:hypothetical protein